MFLLGAATVGFFLIFVALLCLSEAARTAADQRAVDEMHRRVFKGGGVR